MKYKGKVRRKNEKQAFRKLLGFTQDNYALYLGITKGLHSLIELGKRYLHGPANLKNADLFLRWQKFKETFQPPSINEKDLAETKKYLLQRLDNLKFELLSRTVKKEKIETVIDYQMANAFLEIELAQNQIQDDVLPLYLTRRLNIDKIPKTPYLNALKDSLEDRFLAFQVAEMQKELKSIEN